MNLRSDLLDNTTSSTNSISYNPLVMNLTCINRLGQTLLLSKDSCKIEWVWIKCFYTTFIFIDGKMVSLTGVASGRITNELLGTMSSAYIIERPLLNGLQPTFALNEPLYNSSNDMKMMNLLILLLITIICINQQN